MTIVSAEQQGEDVYLMAELTKLRPCEYIGVSWYKVDSFGTKNQIRVTSMRDPDDISSPTRPVGRQTIGPWLFKGLVVEDLQQNIYAELTHRCHPMWLTTTNFWP